MVSTSPISNSYTPSHNPVSKSPITTGIIVTMIHSFFKVQVFIFFFTFLQFYSMVSRDSKVHYLASSIRSGLLAGIPWSVCMSKSHWSLCVILPDRCWVLHIPFVRMVKFKFLAHLPVDHLAHPILFRLNSVCANLLHSLIMWLMVSSQYHITSLAIFLCLIYSHFAIIGFYGFILRCYYERFYFSL